MAIFTDEFKGNFKREGERLGSHFYRDFSNAVSLWWLHLAILIMLIFSTRIMSSFGIVGINAWWEQYSVLNPNVTLEQTTTYWYFLIADRLLFIATALEMCYVALLVLVWGIGDMKRMEAKAKETQELEMDIIPEKEVKSTKVPKCPICKKNMDVIKKGTNLDKTCERYLCKNCGKYFQKKPKEN